MRYRRVYVESKSDGSVVVVSHGPIVAFGRWLRLPVALVFIATSIAAMVRGDWSTGGVTLIIGALLLPNYSKQRRPRL